MVLICYGLEDNDVSVPTLRKLSNVVFVSPSRVVPAGLKRKRFREALEDAEACCGLDETFARGHGRRGEALLGLRRVDAAAKALRRATELDPADAASKLLLSQVDEAAPSGLLVRQLLPGPKGRVSRRGAFAATRGGRVGWPRDDTRI